MVDFHRPDHISYAQLTHIGVVMALLILMSQRTLYSTCEFYEILSLEKVSPIQHISNYSVHFS